MSPRSLSPRSDGELSRSDDGEKVYKNAHARKNTNVDPSARPTSSSRSSRPPGMNALMYDPEAHFNGYVRDRSRSRSRSPFRHDRDRSRSRSPYRADRDTGREKRRHQDDHYGKGASDPLRHKVYEDRPARGHGSHNNNRNPNRPSQSSGGVTNNNNYNNDRRGRCRGNRRDSYGDRNRDKSRSPYRAAAGNSSRPRSRQGPTSPANSWGQSGHTRRGSTPFTQRESTPQASRDDADTRGPSSRTEHSATASQDVTKASEQLEEEEPEPEKKLSDAEIIEQRRKRREAIKKKHATNDSLLRTTLEGNLPSSAATPQDESASGSQAQSPTSPSSASSPGTPGDSTSAPASPAAFAALDEQDLANPLQVNATTDDQGQSAADYDPNQDMNEDRPEFKQQLEKEEDQPRKDSTAQAPPKKSADDFDMFAEDDDDMFAFDDGPAEKAPVKQARALDESMLDNWDYLDGHYRIINGELLDGKYAVEQQVGKGTFATVVRATDTTNGTKVAIKIACRNDTMLKAGQKEMRFVERLNEKDPDDKRYVIRLLGNFMHKGHLCLVFEGLQMDMRELLKKFGRDIGIQLDAVKVYAYQMFQALFLLKSAEVLHADLKPDNILINEKHTVIKVCDFGTATLQQDAELTPYLVSRFYRAPEVIIGMDFDYAIDMWAIGCTLYELYVGRILFNGSNNNGMLRVIQECRGKLPNRLLKKAKLRSDHFDENNQFYAFERDKMTGNVVPKPIHFGQGLPGKDLKSRLSGPVKQMNPTQLKEHNAFVDLLDKCLQLDPEKRIKPHEALRHHFFGQPAKPKPKTAIHSGAFRPSTVHRAG